MSQGPATRATIDAVWRIESARVVAGVAHLVGDLGLAEDLAQDAFVAALEQWPRDGVPSRPGAWLSAVARRRAIDHLRRRSRLADRVPVLGRRQQVDEEEGAEAGFDAVLDDGSIRDDLLRLICTACHPVLSREARAALTLRLVGGLRTDEIARAFLLPEATVAQRIVRAKRTLSAAQVPFETPGPAELGERLGSVLEVVYLIFNEGYTATAGTDWMRPSLCAEALRLGRVVAGLLPEEAEVHGLVALLEIQGSRVRARVTPAGDPILLLDQDRSRWDPVLIRRGLEAVRRAEELARSGRSPLGPYALQAEIAACHARAARAGDTDWVRIAALYDALSQIRPSPIVELNRAVAVAHAFGPEAALELVDGLADEPSLRSYHLLPSVRGDLLAQLGRTEEARAEFARAASLTRNERERALLERRATEVTPA